MRICAGEKEIRRQKNKGWEFRPMPACLVVYTRCPKWAQKTRFWRPSPCSQLGGWLKVFYFEISIPSNSQMSSVPSVCWLDLQELSLPSLGENQQARWLKKLDLRPLAILDFIVKPSFLYNIYLFHSPTSLSLSYTTILENTWGFFSNLEQEYHCAN